MSDPKQRKIAGVDPAMPANQSRAVTGTIPGDWMDLKSAAEGPPRPAENPRVEDMGREGIAAPEPAHSATGPCPDSMLTDILQVAVEHHGARVVLSSLALTLWERGEHEKSIALRRLSEED